MDAITLDKLKFYNIGFIKKSNGVKQLIGDSYLAGFIAAWGYFATPEDIDDFIVNIDRCINNQFDYDLEDVTMYSINNYHVELTPSGLKFYSKNLEGKIISTQTFPYEDIKILLKTWKEFLVND